MAISLAAGFSAAVVVAAGGALALQVCALCLVYSIPCAQ